MDWIFVIIKKNYSLISEPLNKTSAFSTISKYASCMYFGAIFSSEETPFRVAISRAVWFVCVCVTIRSDKFERKERNCTFFYYITHKHFRACRGNQYHLFIQSLFCYFFHHLYEWFLCVCYKSELKGEGDALLVTYAFNDFSIEHRSSIKFILLFLLRCHFIPFFLCKFMKLLIIVNLL